MVICTRRTMAAFDYVRNVEEQEWIQSQKALNFLDLADHNGALHKKYKEFYLEHCSQIGFSTEAFGIGATVDDCLILFVKINNDSIFFQDSMMERMPDWIGRNFFMDFIKSLKKTRKNLSYGENSVNFLKLASLCGYKHWSKIVSDYYSTIHCIFPSILKGLYRNRMKYPLLLKELLDMFCWNNHDTRLFSDMPDGEHLDFVLDVAKQTCFDLSIYSLEELFCMYVSQGRCHMVMKLFKYGIKPRVRSISKLFNELHGHLLRKNTRTSDLYQRDFKEMFRMLFLSLPVPFPSPSTVRRVMLKDLSKVNCMQEEYRYLSSDFGLDTLYEGRVALWKGLVNAYETCGIVPPDYPGEEVRKLSHLCRCSIRERLRASFQLPTGIDTLDIPTDFKSFLKFQTEEGFEEGI